MRFIDMHCDTISKLRQGKGGEEKGSLRENELQLDLRRMREAGYLVQTFAMFVDKNSVHSPFQECIKLIDRFYQEMEANKDWIAPVTSYQEILENQKEGKMSAILSVEEGACCQGNLEFLRTLYRLGVRMLTLTWNYPNELGWPNRGKPDGDFLWGKEENKQGLTETGIEFIKEMERLGMLIDVSHLGDAGFYEVYRNTERPFIASHSNSRAVCKHVRNLTDDMIRKIAERGGVIGINFCADFTKHSPDEKSAEGTIEGLLCHMRHIVNIGGVECVGLGTDFDGIERNIEMDDCSMMPQLVRQMEEGGFSGQEIEAICYRNVLRVVREVL